MTVTTAIARAAANTANGNQDITDASFGGGTPKGCIVMFNDAIADGTAVDGARACYGFASGASNQGCMSWNQEHNTTPSDNRSDLEFDKIIDGRLLGSSTALFNAVFVSFITNGIRINWVVAPAAASLITVVIFGGDDFQCFVDNYALGLPDSVVDVTAPGFRPDVVISLNVFANGSNSSRTGHGFTWDDNGSITQITRAIYNNNGANPTDISNSIFGSFGGGLKLRTSANEQWALEFSDFDSSGFTTTLRGLDATGASNLYFAMDFGPNNVFMGSYVTPVATGNDVEVVGFKPQLVLMAMLQDVTAFDTQFRGGSEGFNVFNETSEFCNSTSDEDGVDTIAVGTNTQSLSSAKALDLPDGVGTLEAVATLASFDATGYTLNYTTVPGTQRAYFQLVIGEDVAGLGDNAAIILKARGEDEMGAIVQRREFIELTSAASRVESAPYLLGGNSWEVQFKGPGALAGIEGSNDLEAWNVMKDLFNVAIDTKTGETVVGLERPKWLRTFVAIDAGQPQVFSQIINVQKQQGS